MSDQDRRDSRQHRYRVQELCSSWIAEEGIDLSKCSHSLTLATAHTSTQQRRGEFGSVKWPSVSTSRLPLRGFGTCAFPKEEHSKCERVPSGLKMHRTTREKKCSEIMGTTAQLVVVTSKHVPSPQKWRGRWVDADEAALAHLSGDCVAREKRHTESHLGGTNDRTV